MLPILRKMKERKDKPQSAGIITENRPSDSPEALQDPSEAVEPCMIHFLGAIAANDPKAMAQALTQAHDIMHEEMKKQSTEPHSFAAQNIKTTGEY